MELVKYATEPPKTRQECHEAYTEVCRRLEAYYLDGQLEHLLQLDFYRRLEAYLDNASAQFIQYGKVKKYPCKYSPKKQSESIVYRCSGCKKQQESVRNLLVEKCGKCGGDWELYDKRRELVETK